MAPRKTLFLPIFGQGQLELRWHPVTHLFLAKGQRALPCPRKSRPIGRPFFSLYKILYLKVILRVLSLICQKKQPQSTTIRNRHKTSNQHPSPIIKCHKFQNYHECMKYKMASPLSLSKQGLQVGLWVSNHMQNTSNRWRCGLVSKYV